MVQRLCHPSYLFEHRTSVTVKPLSQTGQKLRRDVLLYQGLTSLSWSARLLQGTPRNLALCLQQQQNRWTLAHRSVLELCLSGGCLGMRDLQLVHGLLEAFLLCTAAQLVLSATEQSNLDSMFHLVDISACLLMIILYLDVMIRIWLWPDLMPGHLMVDVCTVLICSQAPHMLHKYVA